MYAGEVEGRGPRYCPSIEDKVIRFADKERHILFVEPDGTKTSEVYLQGFSSSMPPELQDDMIRTLPGFERAEIHRYAYAVEYDALDPTNLTLSMMSRAVPGAYSALARSMEQAATKRRPFRGSLQESMLSGT